MAEKQTDKAGELQRENERLREELWRLKRKPEGRIGYVLLAVGFFLVALAVYYSHNVSAFLGMALTFWGALLLYVRPTQFIKKEILDHSVTEPHQNLARLLRELDYVGTPTYISPGTLWGMNNTVLWIPKEDGEPAPSDEQLSGGQISLLKPLGLVLTPPGQALSSLIEGELNTSFARVDLDYLAFNLEKAFVEGLEIAESFIMETLSPLVRVEVKGNIFSELVTRTMAEGENTGIGDTFHSAVASILARTTRHPVTIESIEVDGKNRTVTSTYRLHGPQPEEPGEQENTDPQPGEGVAS